MRYPPSFLRGAPRNFLYNHHLVPAGDSFCLTSHVSLERDVTVVILPVPDSQATVSVMNDIALLGQAFCAGGMLVSPKTLKWPSRILS